MGEVEASEIFRMVDIYSWKPSRRINPPLKVKVFRYTIVGQSLQNFAAKIR